MKREVTGVGGTLALLLALLSIGVCALEGRAQTASGPAGFYKVTCLGNSDTIVSIPFSRPAEALGLVESIVEDVEGDVTNGLVTVKGTPGWLVDQFVYAPVTQSNTYCLRFLTGAKEGSYYPVLSNGTNSLTIDLSGEDLSAVTNGTRLAVVPYWTLGTIFPGGKSVIPSPSVLIHRTEVLVPNFNGVGINLAPSATYYYLASSNWWCRVNDAGGIYGTANKNDDVLLPDIYFIVRHNTSTNTVLTAQGSVPVSKLATPIITRQGSKQDNFVALVRPATVTLDDSGLVQSGAFLPSPSVINHTDELLVFDNTRTNKNKSPAATYYYLGTSNRWCRVNDAGGIYGTSNMGSQAVFTPGIGVIVRKKATAGGVPSYWINSATY